MQMQVRDFYQKTDKQIQKKWKQDKNKQIAKAISKQQ